MKTIRENESPNAEQANSEPKLYAWLASSITIILIIVIQFLPHGENTMMRICGVVVLVIAAIFIFSPFYLLAKHGSAQAEESYMQTGKVVHHGLYALIRHPQYLGYMLLSGGFALLRQHWVAVLLGIAGIAGFYIQAMQEESHCLARFREPYARYLQCVPRFNLLAGLWRILRGYHHD